MGSLQLQKTGNDTAYDAVTGAEFSVVGPSPSTSVAGSLLVGPGGASQILTGLVPGTYTVTETVPPPGYQSVAPVQVAVTEGMPPPR